MLNNCADAEGIGHEEKTMTTKTLELRRESVARARDVERLVTGEATSDGAGVKLTRVLTQQLQRRLDPFLMLDAFGTDNPQDYIGGFPDHPHRGFETVTYMIAGRMRHRDSAGHEGLLSNGGVQWMTAGKGVIHSELPEQEDGRMEGFQLWLNLPAKDKLRAPWYRDIQSAEIPEFATEQGVKVRVIAGASHGVAGAMEREVTEPLYLDLELPAGSSFEQALPPGHNAFVYVYRGGVEIGATHVPAQRMAILGNGADRDGIVLQSHRPSRVLLIAGKPLGEPIAQYGPFVMNTHDEIIAAVKDYQAGKFAA
jgi:redox-sensitive bicupin YhaK (pirin superfamily)